MHASGGEGIATIQCHPKPGSFMRPAVHWRKSAPGGVHLDKVCQPSNQCTCGQASCAAAAQGTEEESSTHVVGQRSCGVLIIASTSAERLVTAATGSSSRECPCGGESRGSGASGAAR